MSIIDERGRLFGKINLIDFLILLFVFCLIPLFYLGYKVILRKPEAVVKSEREFVQLEIDCQLIKLPPELLKVISVGDQEVTKNGEVIGEITSLGQSGPYRYEFDIGGEGQRIIKEDPVLKQLEAKVRLKAEIKGKYPYYKDMPINVDLPLEFNTDKYSIVVMPVPIAAPTEVLITELEIDCQLIKLRPELLQVIAVGDQEVTNDGEVIGAITSLGQSGPYRYELDIGKGQKIIKENPVLKQLEAKVRLKVMLSKNSIYYKGKEVKVDSPLEFNTGKYNCLIRIPKERLPVVQEEKTIPAIVTVKFENLIPELSKAIKSGDKQVETVKSNIKMVAAKLIRVVSNEPAEFVSLIPQMNRWNIVGHPKNRNIVLEIETLCIRRPEGLFRKNESLKVGMPFVFSTDLYTISGMIINVREKQQGL